MAKKYNATTLTKGQPKSVDNAPKPDLSNAGAAVLNLFDQYKKARVDRERTWLEAWGLYMGTPESLEYLRGEVGRIVGDVSDDWRHRISNGKGYEIVETIVGYLMSGFFPTSEWMAYVPSEAGQKEVARLVSKYVQKKMSRSRFSNFWEMHIRQLLITGFSCIALPYREELIENYRHKPGQLEGVRIAQTTKLDGFEFEVWNSFDVFVDPIAQDVQKANVIRRLRKTKAQVMRLIAGGVYNELDGKAVALMSDSKYRREAQGPRVMLNFMGVEYDPQETVDVLEFWGDITIGEYSYHDVTITLVGDQVARIEPNPYWGGRPFIVGTCIPVVGISMGMSPLEPVMGMLHEMNIIGNQRLDNLALEGNSMWEMLVDGVLNPDEVYVKPGHILEVSTPGAIKPIPMGNSSYVSYQESSLLEQRADRVTGTGAYIGTAQGRRGERVTAQEINAIRDAGGNRLSLLHRNIEEGQLIPLLRKVYAQLQQFVEADEIVSISSPEGDTLYVSVGPPELASHLDVEAYGATHLVDRQLEQETVVNFIQLCANIPMLGERVNWDVLTELLTRKLGLHEDLERILAPTTPPVMSQQNPADVPPEASGMPLEEQAISEALMAAGGIPAASKAQEMGLENIIGATTMAASPTTPLPPK